MRTPQGCIREHGRHRGTDFRSHHGEHRHGLDPRLSGMRRGGPRARRGDVRLAILAILGQAPANGYSLIGQITDRTDGRWRPSPGSIYPVLRQLTEEGLIASEGEGDEHAGYSITEQGQAFLAANQERIDRVWENGRAFTDGQEQLHQGLRKLMGATRELSESGTEEQRTRAVELLDEARRKIYGMLAE
jgi:DNA-binding PadR family transcriptional regulator